ncbi:MAG: polyprenyl synthetase family protein [Clostridiales Family XIII bacterium]|jgi:geranylgeranyl diphosphate synthase type II|nr:polyprenyl synthetase family protein [Clostridiales Family XIII bacterium]
MKDSFQELYRYLELVDSNLQGLLPEIDSKSRTLLDAMRYTLNAKGKRIRPILLLLTCESVGGDVKAAIPYACAIEFIHSYSLIHDDLPAMDDDDLRRGEPTNHKVFGEGMAVLAGDGLLSAAFELIHKQYLIHLDDPEKLRRHIRAGAEIAKGCGCRGMVSGQAADLESEGLVISAELLDYIHINKTAALIRAAICAGAYLGGAGEQDVRNLSDYGENLGLAFQVMDDILDVTGETEMLGKTAGKDEEAHKSTYPSVHGLDASRERLAELTARAAASVEKTSIGGGYKDQLSDLARALARRVY